MSWRKVTLGELVEEFSFRPKDMKLDPSTLKFFGVSNTEGIIPTKNAAKDKADKYKILEKDCFAYNPYRINVGSIALLEEDIKGLISPAYVVFKPKPKSIIPQLLLMFLKSQEGLRQIKIHARGTVRQALRFADLCKIELSLPEYDEQIEFFKKIKETENTSQKLTSEFTHQINLVKQLRQAYLREAMRGELLSQDQNDEPASLLLEKIKTEKNRLIKEKKIKKQKTLPPITEDEIFFTIPENWVWCRLGEICNTNGRIGWKGLTSAEYKKAGPLFLSVHSLNYGDYVDYSQAFHISQARYDESPEIMLENDDILICKDGAGIGKLGIIKNLKEQATINSSLLLIRKYLSLNTKFLYYFLLSSHFQKIVNERIMGATTPHLYQRDIVQFPIALPPLSEQEKIVSKLDELLGNCESLELNINKSQHQNELLFRQVLTEALGLKLQKAEPQKKISKKEERTSKFDPNTTLMEIVELLKKHGKLHAEELWKMSKYPDDIDAFYAELKKEIELKKVVKESKEKGYLELA